MASLNRHTSTLTISSQTEHLNDVRDFISNHAKDHGFSDDDVNKISIAVDEACTNIIKHGYKYSKNEKINIEVNRHGNEFEIIISDRGKKFDPNGISTPDMKEYLSQFRRGGLGVYLMKRIMDKVEFNVLANQNQLRMIKYLH
jgi:serine/threonine-protein kinase RsbW